MALNVKSEEPLVFAISASRQNFEGITTDADDLTARFDDASKKSATFKDGDCTLKLTKTELGIDVAQEGPCTSISVHPEMTLDAELHRQTELCWDSSIKAFMVPGTCQPSPGF